MGILVDKQLCDGCEGMREARCVKACPGDLMSIGADTQAFIRAQRDCWDCMACVKSCPQAALETKLPFVLADYGARLVPEVAKDHITWRSIDSQGTEEQFVIKTLEI